MPCIILHVLVDPWNFVIQSLYPNLLNQKLVCLMRGIRAWITKHQTPYVIVRSDLILISANAISSTDVSPTE